MGKGELDVEDVDSQAVGAKGVINNVRQDAHGRFVLDESGESYICRCNATYTGSECCGSTDGMVWLE